MNSVRDDDGGIRPGGSKTGLLMFSKSDQGESQLRVTDPLSNFEFSLVTSFEDVTEGLSFHFRNDTGFSVGGHDGVKERRRGQSEECEWEEVGVPGRPTRVLCGW